jgi:hypothetical protein
MDWLQRPFHFFHPQPELPFELPVVRYEVGLSQRPILDPPGFVEKPTIRFHLAKPISPGLFLAVKTGYSGETDRVSPEELEARPYLDFTNGPLIQRILAIWGDLIERAEQAESGERLRRMAQLAPSSPYGVTLRLVRHGLRIDTRYGVEVVES